jgi:hypothetical protein
VKAVVDSIDGVFVDLVEVVVGMEEVTALVDGFLVGLLAVGNFEGLMDILSK